MLVLLDYYHDIMHPKIIEYNLWCIYTGRNTTEYALHKTSPGRPHHRAWPFMARLVFSNEKAWARNVNERQLVPINW